MADDKYILMNMDDHRSKEIAEVLGNKTCKKILDYLSENSGKSEEDLSKELEMPMNTVEYNIKKLLNSGLIEKDKNFFWSKRGKKIDLYKVAKKHIIISPKDTKPNMKALKTILPILVSAFVILLVAMILIYQNNQPVTPSTESEIANTFGSLDEMKSYIEKNTVENKYYRGGVLEMAVGGLTRGTAASLDSAAPSAGESASDYSSTNIQVEGVDEADIIKNDGKYIYVVSGNKVVIVNAYPAENMEILSEIEIENGSVGEIFINDNKLVVFANEYTYVPYPEVRCMAIGCVMPPVSYKEPRTFVNVYDVSDRASPSLQEEYSVTGNYFNSRMIGDYVYIVTNQYIHENIVLPSIEQGEGEVKIIEPTDIYYTDIRDYGFQYTIVLALNLDNGETSEKAIITGSSQNMYVSQKNIYTTMTKYQSWYEKIDENSEEDTIKTIINKIAIDEMDIEYVASGEVPGTILNQFSMDEYEDNFRIATTISGYSNNVDTSTNNLYVLDDELNILGELEGIAPGESIYSVRFMGKRAYMVTFRHIDPLFVIDLSNPENPEILGKLKIPGYSDYLHPYDETHLIGIGKEVDASIDADKIHTEGAVYYTAIQGVKLAIFDVSDVENPVEMYKEVIGDRGTESPATSNHKAFLFDKSRELLVIPITLAELEEGQDKSQQGDYTFQGAYVYNLNLEDGFDLKGRISHYDKDDDIFEKSGYYFRGEKSIMRSLYMDNILYTFSNEMIKANGLGDLEEINFVDLPYESPYKNYPEIYY